jgi:hypothetical protein
MVSAYHYNYTAATTAFTAAATAAALRDIIIDLFEVKLSNMSFEEHIAQRSHSLSNVRLVHACVVQRLQEYSDVLCKLHCKLPPNCTIVILHKLSTFCCIDVHYCCFA